MQEVKNLSVKSKKPRIKAEDSYIKQGLIAAVLTAVCYIVALACSSKYPLGKYTFLIGDLEAQYAPFLFLYKKQLLSLDWSNPISSFTYSFSLGAGKNMMGTFGYYLASPLNLFVFLFKETQVNEFILFLVGIKLSLASLFMTLFIHDRSTDKKTNWPILFGIMYAFSSYTMAYMFQIMWLDGYALLPLLLLCVEKFIRDRKVGRFIPVLLLLFISNYYIAYMVGAFSFFYLITRMIIENKFSQIKDGMKTVGKFVMTAVFSALAVGIILIPVGIDTLVNGDPTSSVASESIVNYSGIQLLDQIFFGYPGEYSKVMPNNLPFIFVSLMVTFLCVVYFVSDEFKGFERKVHAICMVLVYLSLVIVIVDKAWQVFDEPNWFRHRESFIFMPIFMVIAYKTFEKIIEVSNKDIAKSLFILLALLFVAQSFGAMKERDSVFLFNMFFLIGLALIFAGMKRTEWPKQLANMNQLLNLILVIVILFEVVFLEPIMSAGVSTLSVFYGEAQEYVDQVQIYSDFVEFAGETNDSFRIENINTGVGLDKSYVNGTFYTGTHGIQLFNSNSNKVFHRFLKQFGYSVNYNYFAMSYSFEAPDTDAFFSIGHVISPNDYSAAKPLAVDNYGYNLTLYQNSSFLPLAFPVDRTAFDFDFYYLENATPEKNYFEFRNEWYSSMFSSQFENDFYVDLEGDVDFEYINASEINMNQYISSDSSEPSDSVMVSTSESDVSQFDPDSVGGESLEEDKNVTCYYRINDSIPMVFNYIVTSESEDELYMNVSSPRLVSNCDVYVNGEYLTSWYAQSFYSQVVRIGSFPVGQDVQISIVSDNNKYSVLDVNFAYFNEDLFTNQFETIDLSGVNVVDIHNGVVKITSDLNDNRLILTTIPYEEGWTLYIDGVQSDITVYQDALIGIDAGSGHHEIELKYIAPGVQPGAVCSIIGVIGLVAIILIEKKQQKTTK